MLAEMKDPPDSNPHDNHGDGDLGDGSESSKAILKKIVGDGSNLKKIEDKAGSGGKPNDEDGDGYSLGLGSLSGDGKSIQVTSMSINWNDVLKTTARSTVEDLSWYHTYNKYEYVLGSMTLPAHYDNVPEKSIVIIMDTSGTCSKLIPSFSGLLKSCFNYRDSPAIKLTIDVIIFASSAIRYHNERDIKKLVRAPVGYGTNIKAVRTILENFDYDEYVCVTDGYTDGTVLGSEDPSKWVWIFPKAHSTKSAHKSSRKIVLTDL
jgi:hypothetical protein